MRVIGVDPGKTTGLCSFGLVDGAPVCVESYELDYMGVGSYLDQQLQRCLDNCVVVCEAFIITPQTAKNSQAPWSLEVIGITRFFSALYGIEMLMYAPSSHKRLITNEVLKRAGLYVRGDHARDAARIALYHIVTDMRLMQDSLKEESGDSANVP